MAAKYLSIVTVIITLWCLVSSTTYPTPAATYEANSYTTWNKLQIKGCKKGTIVVPLGSDSDPDDSITMDRLDLIGDSRTRGFAHGAFLAEEIVVFTGPKLDQYYASVVVNIDISNYPEPLQDILKVAKVAGALMAPKFFKQAMSWVWEQEKFYVPQYILDEIEGMADGICYTLNKLHPNQSCNSTEWEATIQQLNMLPELIRMACTAFGAWGKAVPSQNTLVQLRALDFGSGPWSNYTILTVHREIPGNDGKAYASVAYPGFVGAITGISNSGIGISEKVWMTYDNPNLLPGSYQGEADIFILRDILEQARNRDEAEKFLSAASRTWAMWIGIGDYSTMQFDLVGYTQNSSTVYTDVTMPSMTGQPYLESVCYVDKHPQPSDDGASGTLPTALTSFYGNITLENTKVITMYHRTGDTHIAIYDYGNKEMYVAVGRINIKGEYKPLGGTDDDIWCAYNRPYLKFDLDDLWAGI